MNAKQVEMMLEELFRSITMSLLVVDEAYSPEYLSKRAMQELDDVAGPVRGNRSDNSEFTKEDAKLLSAAVFRRCAMIVEGQP